MTNSFAAGELLWEEQQCAMKVQAGVERRAWLKRFALVFALILVTLAVATGFAAFGSGVAGSL